MSISIKVIKYNKPFYLLSMISFFSYLFIYLISPTSLQEYVCGEMNCKTIDNFEESGDTISKKWISRNASREETSKIYKIKSENNNRFLHAASYGTSIQIVKKVNWDLKSYPILSWKWRVIRIPKGANEEARGRNDSAAAVYAIFQRSRIPFLSWKYQPINVIKYVWSSSLPKGKIIKKNKVKMGKTIYEGRFLVLKSGNEQLRKWITEKRNVLLDYIHLFGDSPKYNPLLIGILTDSNDTKSSSISDYDDIVIQKLDDSLRE